MARVVEAADSGSKLNLPAFEPPQPRVIGHSQNLEQLAHAVAHGTFAPAYVFSGPRGVGKRTVAFWFARMLLCEGRPPGALAPCNACNPCNPCERILGGNHPDVYEVRKEVGRTDIRVDEVLRPMLRAACFGPSEASHRVFLLSEAEYLNVAGMNALLKSLEEPRTDQVFILVTPSSGRLLPTVMSRCQSQRFSPVPREAIVGWLRQQGEAEGRAEMAATLGEGCPGQALARLRDKGYWETRDKELDFASLLSRGDMARALGVIEKMDDLGDDRRAEIERKLGFLVSWYRDLLWLAEGYDAGRIVNSDRLADLERSGPFTVERLLGALQALNEARGHMMGNAHTKLLFTRLSFHLIPHR